MKHFLRTATILLGLLALPGCSGQNLGDLLQAVTTAPIANPIDATDIYRAKNVYAAGLQGMKDYRAYCWSKSYAAILADPVAKPVCQSRRSVYRTMAAARTKAGSAIVSATTFVRDNPTINAAGAIASMWAAVTNFQNAVPALK